MAANDLLPAVLAVLLLAAELANTAVIRYQNESLDCQRPYAPPDVYDSFEFTLDSWPAANYRHKLGVTRSEAERLIEALELDCIEFRYGYQPSAALALCITLARLKYPSTWPQHLGEFGRSAGYLSVVFNDVVEHLSTRFDEQIRWHPRLRSYQRLRRFATAINDAGANGLVWGFIDGHFMAHARPVRRQRLYYSGHTKSHGIKLQAIVTPDGLISSLEGPFIGKDNDWNIYKQTRIQRRLERLLHGNEPLFLYGDPAYNNAYGIMCPFQHPAGCNALLPLHQEFNARMASLRISVEHAFGQVWRQWTYTAFAKGLRVGNQALGSYYRVAVLLVNCLTCLQGGNQTSEKYGVMPPELHEFLGKELPVQPLNSPPP